MKYLPSEYFFLEAIRNHMRKTFFGVDGVTHVFWLVYHNVIGLGDHKWLIKVRYVTENNSLDAIYDKEIDLCAEYRDVHFSFLSAKLSTYDDYNDMVRKMADAGYYPIV